MKYTPLADDLSKLIESYDGNSLITRHQREIWKPDGRKKAVTHGMLGKDHPKALRLLEQEGYDGRPVGSLSSRSAESFWYHNDNHIFPPEADLIRLGIFMHLDVYRILALVLKEKWEEFFAREVCEWRANVGKNLTEVLQNEEGMSEAINRFNFDTNQLFLRLFEHENFAPNRTKSTLVHETNLGLETFEVLVEEMTDRMHQSGIRWLIEAGYTPEAFDTLVQRMLLNQIHWVATDSLELDHFKKRAVEEVIICIQGTDKQREGYWFLTQVRNQLLMDLDEMYIQIESTRLHNTVVNSKYLNIFGEYEIALREAEFRYYELEQKVLLKRANPDLTREKLDEQVQKKIEEMRKKLKRFWEEVNDASLIDLWDPLREPSGGGSPLTEEDKTAYIAKCKKILRKIYLLIHPDRLKNDAVYQKLTSEQREELKHILQEALKIRRGEPIYQTKYIESRYRSPEALQAVLERVRFILENAGIDIDPRTEIKGNTLPDRLSWLEKDITHQEKYLESARVELQVLVSDEDIQQKRGILANEKEHEEIEKKIEEQADEYRKKADALEVELETLLGGDAA